MLARMWTTEVDLARADEYETFAREMSLPMFRSMPGCEGVLMYRSETHCHVLTMWRAPADITALEGSELYRKTVEQIVARRFLKGTRAAASSFSRMRSATCGSDRFL